MPAAAPAGDVVTQSWPVLPADYRPAVIADLAADPAGLVATATGGGRHSVDPDERRRAWGEPLTEVLDGAALAALLAADQANQVPADVDEPAAGPDDEPAAAVPDDDPTGDDREWPDLAVSA
jgi:hypothetical protein